MRKFTDKLYDRMLEELDDIGALGLNKILRAEKSYHVVETCIKELKGFIIAYDFADGAEEILFFKEIKPKFQSELYYFLHIVDFESRKPLGDNDMLHKYHTSALHVISSYFEQNQVLYTYYRLGRTDKDPQYFLRASEHAPLLPVYTLDFDRRFSTLYSMRLAELLGFELMRDYINGSIYQLEMGNKSDSESCDELGLTWTDKDVYLLEVITAIHSNRSVNGGKVSFQKLINGFGWLFNKDFKNFHRTLQNMRIRKKDRTPYLKLCIENVEKYMDEVDIR